MANLRVALLTDSWDEANGVATLSRHLAGFARTQGLPFLSVHGGRETTVLQEGSLRTVTLRRGPGSFPLDRDLYCDPFLLRHRSFVIRELNAFKPDLIQITGPGDLGFFGALVAHQLKVPLVASWHTNLHEYASRRLEGSLWWLPKPLRKRLAAAVERQSLRGIMRFYRLACFTLAPNPAAIALLRRWTNKPVLPVDHGVDLDQFHPAPECRRSSGVFRIGYVGRLTPEKNVRAFAEIEARLLAAGQSNFEMVMVGEGSEQPWLQNHLTHARFSGVLRGSALADAFASLDAFVFPSVTDTFGLVVLEALASGVPVVVTPQTGAHVGIMHRREGLVDADLAGAVLELMRNETLRSAMAGCAREFARSHNWNTVFERWYGAYEIGLGRDLGHPAADRLVDPGPDVEDGIEPIYPL